MKTYDKTQIKATIFECKQFIEAHKSRRLRIALTAAITSAYSLIAVLEKIQNDPVEYDIKEKP